MKRMIWKDEDEEKKERKERDKKEEGEEKMILKVPAVLY